MDFLLGAVTATACITIGHILHMRWIDRKLLPPPAKPGKPTLTLVGKDGGGQ